MHRTVLSMLVGLEAAYTPQTRNAAQPPGGGWRVGGGEVPSAPEP